MNATYFHSIYMSTLVAPAYERRSVSRSILGQSFTFGQRRPMEAAPSRRKKALTLRDSDWEPMRVRIVQLYVEENYTIPQLREAIKREFRFQAT